MKKIKKIMFLVIIVIVSFIFIISLITIKIKNDKIEIANQNKIKIEEIIKHYSTNVKTIRKTKLYSIIDEQYQEIGSVSEGVTLSLKEVSIDENTLYFPVEEFEEEYYISYKDVTPNLETIQTSVRYQNYIPFNQNVITNNPTKFYDDSGNLLYEIEESFNLPIYIKEENEYSVLYNNKLLVLKKDNIEKEIESENTTEINTPNIGVLNYHFFYDDSQKEEKEKCNQVICTSKSQFKEHLEYFKNNNFFTPTMKELEFYIDGKLQLPKSIVITIDDGWRMELGLELLNEYKLNATAFIVTSWYDPNAYKSEYIEVHSHTDNMHNVGDCPTGQGGGIQCLSRETILNDLKTSSEKLNGSTVFCYPFYEYNNYSISLLKEAGYTMAFAGPRTGTDGKIKVGSDKYTLPRYVITSSTNVSKLKTFLG